jgi:hypothetical protein
MLVSLRKMASSRSMKQNIFAMADENGTEVRKKNNNQ